MTKEEQRIAIAEACGWKQIQEINGVLVGIKGMLRGWIPIPNYHSDLNAMHEAEKVLGQDHKQWRRYCDTLHGAACGWNISATMGLVHLTASQRAEAFLKTIGKWKDQSNPSPTPAETGDFHSKGFMNAQKKDGKI